jgi:hypothetical protein
MEEGSKITGHTTSSTWGVIDIGSANSTFRMNGGEITGNHSTSTAHNASGGVFHTNGGFDMISGKIHGNTTAFNGGSNVDVIITRAGFSLGLYNQSAEIGTLMLLHVQANPIEIQAEGGTISALNLYSNAPLATVIDNWSYTRVIRGWDSANINRITLGNFVGENGVAPITDTHFLFINTSQGLGFINPLDP